MTKQAALYSFFSSFGITAYPNTSVPDNAAFPYLTYEVYDGEFGDEPVGITVNLWFYTDSEAIPNAKAQEIRERIGKGGIQLECDNGCIWLLPGSPWCQSLNDGENQSIKCRYINITLIFNTL